MKKQQLKKLDKKNSNKKSSCAKSSCVKFKQESSLNFLKLGYFSILVFMFLIIFSTQCFATTYLKTDKEVYLIDEIVTIFISNQSTKFIDIAGPSTTYSLFGEAGTEQKFMPPETGNYTIILKDEFKILETKTFKVVSPVYLNELVNSGNNIVTSNVTGIAANNDVNNVAIEGANNDELLGGDLFMESSYNNYDYLNLSDFLINSYDGKGYGDSSKILFISSNQIKDGRLVLSTQKSVYKINELVHITMLADKELEEVVIYSQESEYHLIVDVAQNQEITFIPDAQGKYVVFAKLRNDVFYYGVVFFVDENDESLISKVLTSTNDSSVDNSYSNNLSINLTSSNITNMLNEFYDSINNNSFFLSTNMQTNMQNKLDANLVPNFTNFVSDNVLMSSMKKIKVVNSKGRENKINITFYKNSNSKAINNQTIDNQAIYGQASNDQAINSEMTIDQANVVEMDYAENIISENEVLQFDKYDVELNIENSSVKKLKIKNMLYVQGINLGVDNLPKEKFEIGGQIIADAFAINLDGATFDETIASITAKGEELWKCALWNFTDQTCMGSWEKIMDLEPGQDYNITLFPGDPGYLETYSVFQSADLDIIGLDNETFVVATVDNITGYNISFQVWNTNGSILTPRIVVDATGGLTSRVALTPINSSHFVIAIFDQPQNNIDFFVYDREGTQIVGRTNAAATVGAFTDVKLCQLGDRFPIAYSRTSNDDAELRIYNNTGVLITGTTQIDTGMGTALASQNLLSCSAINRTAFVYHWFDDASNDATFVVRSATGTSIVAETDFDTDVGETAQIASASLGNNRFVGAYYDSTDDDITINIRQLNGATASVVLAATDIDTNAGTDSRIDVAPIKINNTNYFVVVWRDTSDTTIKAGVYNQSGSQITAPFNITTTPNTTFPLIAVAGFEPVINLGLCNGTFIVAYTNATAGSLIKKYWYNGTAWDGVCPDYVSPIVQLNEPLNNSNLTENVVEFNFTGTDNRDVILPNCSLWGNFSSSWQRDLIIYNVSVGVKTNISKYGITDGTYIWNVQCFDNSSNFAFADSNYTLRINNQTPYIRNYYINQTEINQSNKIKFNVTITDSFGISQAIATLRYPNTTEINYTLSNSGSEYYYIFNETADAGTYDVLLIWAIDNLNQENINTTLLQFNVTVSPPYVFNLISPENNTKSQQLVPTFTWTQTTDETFANYTVLISTDLAFTTIIYEYATYNITNTTRTATYALDSNTVYYWKVIANDVFGNQRNSTQEYVYVADTIGPSIDLNVPQNDSFWTNTNVIFNYTPTDVNSLQSCTLYGNFTGTFERNTTNDTIVNGDYNYFNLVLPEGIYLWTIFCNDTALNGKFAAVNNTFFLDLSGPIINLTFPDNNYTENLTNNVVFKVIANDTFTNISSCSLIVNNSVEKIKYTITNNVEFNFTNFLLNGNYTWNVNCTDLNGFETSTLARNISVLVIDHNPPLVTLNHPVNEYVPDRDITFNYTAEDATGIKNCSLYIDGVYNRTNTTNVQNFLYNYFNVLNLAEGSHTWQVRCTDNSTELNQGSSNIRTFYIDTINPSVTLHRPGNLTIVSDWFNSSFEYRTKHKINGSSYGLLENYSMNIIVHYGSGVNAGNHVYLGGHSKTDFGDIRFVNANDDEELGYYIANKTDSNFVSFWVMLPSIDVTNGTYLYVYYGNNNVATTSDGSKAFEFFDDFSNGLTKWEVDSENTDAVIINLSIGNLNPALVHYPDTTQTKNAYYDTRVRTKDYKITDGIIDYDLFISGTSRAIHQFGWRVNNLSFTSGYAWRLQTSSADGGFFEFTNDAWTQLGTAYPAISSGNWYSVSINVSSSNYFSLVNPGTSLSTTDNTKTTSDYLTSHVHATGTDYYVALDNVRVRKFVSPEPKSDSWEIEEKRSAMFAEYVNTSDVIFNYTPSDTYLANCSLYGNFTGVFIEDQIDINVLSNQVNLFSKTLIDGSYLWNILCADLSNRSSFSSIDYLFNVDTISPQYSNIVVLPENLAAYNESEQYVFNITWSDNFELTQVVFENNFSGIFVNTTVTSITQTYSFTTNNLSAGTYSYKWYAIDAVGNNNATEIIEYIVNKSTSSINLTLNLFVGNISINEDNYVNITAQLIVPAQDNISVYLNQIQISSGASPLSNLTFFEDPGMYEVVASYEETQNYSLSNKTYYVQVNDTTSPMVNLIRPKNNGRTSSGESILQYNVTDKSNITNCSLFINGVYNQTSLDVVRNETQLFTVILDDGEYLWNITCFDLSGNYNSSLTWNMSAVSSNSIDLNITPKKTGFEKGEIAQIDTTSTDIFENILVTNITTDVIKGNTTLTWWNSSWLYRRQILIDNTVSRQRLETITINITNLTGFISSCNEIRIVRNYTINNTPVNEMIPLIPLYGNTDSCAIQFTANLTANMVNISQYFVYFGNSLASGDPGFTLSRAGLRVQRGTIVGTATTLTANINEVVLENTFVVFTAIVASSRPDRYEYTPTMTLGTEINFARYGTTTSGTINWEAIETTDAKVQRGTTTYTTTQNMQNVTITAVNLSKAFIIVDGRSSNTLAASLNQGFFTGRFLNATMISLERGTTGSTATVAWQVVELNNSEIQGNMTSLTGTGAIINVSSINVSRSILVLSRATSGQTGIGANFVAGQIVNSTQINFSRTYASGRTNVSWFLIELPVEYFVQKGTETISTADVNSAITKVDPSKAFHVQSWSSTGTTSTTYTNSMLNVNLTNSTNIFFDKYSTTQTLVVPWFLAESTIPSIGFGAQHELMQTSSSQTDDYGIYSVFFNTSNKTYGIYSVVSLATKDAFRNETAYATFEIIPDVTPPNVTLIAPYDFEERGSGYVNFSYTPFDINLNNCTLYIDLNGTFLPNFTDIAPINNVANNITNIYVGIGVHKWNIGCLDTEGNLGFASANYSLNISAPDLTLSSSDIWFGDEERIEGLNITIYANVTNEGLSAANDSFIVQFYYENPESGGVLIQNKTILNLSSLETVTVNTTLYLLKIGKNNIYVKIDSINTINESKETNNVANNTVLVSLYQYYYANVSAKLVLGTFDQNTLMDFKNLSPTGGIVLFADEDSSFAFTDLKALTRNINDQLVGDDFSNIDQAMNTTDFDDSIKSLWGAGSDSPIQTKTFEIASNSINDVPIINSTNTSSFVTGILWDINDDQGNLQYDAADKEDVIFVTEINSSKQGLFGVYDTEIKIPATLREYKPGNERVAVYIELN